MPPHVRDWAQGGKIAGLVFFRRNIESLAQWTRLIDEVDQAFRDQPPPILAVDQEGGLVQRLKAPAVPATPIPAMGTLDLPLADYTTLGQAMGAELRALGINTNFAPVVDIHTEPKNPIIGVRAFAQDAANVTQRAGAFAEGLASSKITWCLKHFPGHGDTAVDSHTTLPIIEHGLETLRAREWHPYLALASRAPMVMSAHILLPKLDPDWPATLSPHIIPRILREELGYQGLTVSDDLDMAAIRKYHDGPTIARGLTQADIDIPLACRDQTLVRALLRHLPPNPAAEARVDALRATLPRPRIAPPPPWPWERNPWETGDA